MLRSSPHLRLILKGSCGLARAQAFKPGRLARGRVEIG